MGEDWVVDAVEGGAVPVEGGALEVEAGWVGP